MSSDPGTPTLDQLKVLLTVVDVGSFAAAARKLNRATSVISYTIANLESQLGVTLFDRASTRKPQLTDAGRTVLAEARTVSNGVDELRARVKGLLQGLEPEVHQVLDVMLPTARVVDALTAFRAAFPTVTLRLHVEALGAVMQLVLDRTATVGVSGPLPGLAAIAGIERIGIGEVTLVPVAAPEHPLAQAGKRKPGEARDHIQLVLTDRSSLTQSLDFAVVSPRTWRLADLGSKHMLLKAGIGWGNMPKPMVQEDLDSGRLVELDLPDARSGAYPLDAIHRTDTPPGPAAAWLISRLQAQAAADGAATEAARRSRRTKRPIGGRRRVVRKNRT
jgi:DNA-binding transcriptional LysR family regulator